MNDPLITTLIPTYQRAALLKRSLKSVLNQTEKRFLVQIYDNDSQDETADIVAQFQKQDRRIQYFKHPTNLGLFENFKSCLSNIQTPYFSFLSDDDFILPWFYETALKEFEKYPDIGFAITRTLTINEKGQIDLYQAFNVLPEGYHKSMESTSHILEKAPFWTGIVYKTSILKKLNTLNSHVGNAFDIDFTLRASLHFPFSYVKKESACFVSWPKGASYASDYYNIWLEFKEMVVNLKKEKINDLLKNKLQKKEISVLKKLSLKYALEKKGKAIIFLSHLKDYKKSHPLFIFSLNFRFFGLGLSLIRFLRKQIIFGSCYIRIRLNANLKRIQKYIVSFLD